MVKKVVCIQDTNLSRAWARAFLESIKSSGGEISPLVVTVTGFADNQPIEDTSIKQSLDIALAEQKKQYSCDTVASTIFPQSLWNPERGREYLFERYIQILPELKNLASHNKYGLYFERLIAFGPDNINQLDHIITDAMPKVGSSALYVLTYNP